MSLRNNKRHNTRIVIFLLFSYFFCSCIVDVIADDDTNTDFALAGYLPDYRLRAYLDQQLNAKKKTTLNTTDTPMTDLILFSLQPHARGFFGCCLQDDHYELVQEFVDNTRNSPFSTSSSIRVWVTVGGGGRTEAFPEICASAKLRQRVIGSIMNLRCVLQQYIRRKDDA